MCAIWTGGACVGLTESPPAGVLLLLITPASAVLLAQLGSLLYISFYQIILKCVMNRQEKLKLVGSNTGRGYIQSVRYAGLESIVACLYAVL